MNVHSIFESVSGEAGCLIPQGAWTTFIRLQGCNLRCPYCDTKDSRDPKISRHQLTVDEIVQQVKTTNVLITGGEPLEQRHEVFELIKKLEYQNKQVQIETNGSHQWCTLSDLGCWVVDYKCPSSAMWERMLPLATFATELSYSNSIVKFVIDVGEDGMDVRDYNFMWARIFDLNSLGYRGDFIISPLNGKPEALKQIAKGISIMPIDFRSRLILSLQIHKICGLA